MNNMEEFLSGALSLFLILLGVWIIVLIIAVVSIIRRKDMELPVKIFWGLVVFFAPVLGLILYLVFGSRTKTRTRAPMRRY